MIDSEVFRGCRKTLADYLKDLRSVEGGDRQLTSWLKEEGFQTSLRAVSQARPPADTQTRLAQHDTLPPSCRSSKDA